MNRVQPDTTMPRTKVYNTYTALLNQEGTSAPTAIILQNTLSEEITWSRLSAGNYVGTLTGEFTIDKTWVMMGGVGAPAQAGSYDINEVYLSTGADDLLIGVPIEIRVYT